MSTPRTIHRKHWLTVGVKLLIGVALASNCCIGGLLLINHRATSTLEGMIAEVLNIREAVDVNLRETIVRLQNDFMNLPQQLAIDPHDTLITRIEQEYPVHTRELLSGREQYAEHFSRTEKRDLAKGLTFVRVDDQGLCLARGLVDAQGKFTEKIELLRLDSGDPETDRQRLQEMIASATAEPAGTAVFMEKMGLLRSIAADKSLEAEKSRTEILGFIDQINQGEQRMAEASREQRRFSLSMGFAAIMANVLVLFVLTRIIVERPLHRLTAVVEAYGDGRFSEVPGRNRRDQIGVLSRAIDRFREVLLALKREEERKAEDRQCIGSLVAVMTASIHALTDRVGRMTKLSLTLQDLADTTAGEANSVAELVQDTAARTEDVRLSSLEIRSVADDIHRHLGLQRAEMQGIVAEINHSRQQLRDLMESVTEIDGIVNAVHVITDQTKILAINAAIEAVKAGAQGRGFAVVAEEVKNLSQTTAHATQDVLEKIEVIKSSCHSCVTSFDALDRGAEQLREVTAAIDQTVQQQHRLTGAIVELATATSDNTSQVSIRMSEVNGAAGGVLEVSAEARLHVEEIARQLDELLAGSVHELENMRVREGDEMGALTVASSHSTLCCTPNSESPEEEIVTACLQPA